MGKVATANIPLRQKLEAIAKWGGTDDCGNPMAPRPTGLASDFREAIKEEVDSNGRVE